MSDFREAQTYFEGNPAAAKAVLNQVAAEDGDYIVAEVERLIAKYVVLPGAAKLPVALWALATHVFDVFDAHIPNPELDCLVLSKPDFLRA